MINFTQSFYGNRDFRPPMCRKPDTPNNQICLNNLFTVLKKNSYNVYCFTFYFFFLLLQCTITKVHSCQGKNSNALFLVFYCDVSGKTMKFQKERVRVKPLITTNDLKHKTEEFTKNSFSFL